MIQQFIKTIDDLRQTVKVNASLTFTVMVPYLDDAYDKYILPYLGEALVKRLSGNSDNTSDLKLFVLVARALGPLALSLAGQPDTDIFYKLLPYRISRRYQLFT